LKATIVAPEDAIHIWDKVAPMLQEASKHSEGELDVDDFFDFISSGDMNLWIATEDSNIIISMVTQVIHYPQKQVLRVIALSGERFKEVHDTFISMVESFAIRIGCSALELWGRKGWKKLLPEWNDSYTVFTKDLKERMH
jgi:hypothetical protein